jgi:hypothetical protein
MKLFRKNRIFNKYIKGKKLKFVFSAHVKKTPIEGRLVDYDEDWFVLDQEVGGRIFLERFISFEQIEVIED